MNLASYFALKFIKKSRAQSILIVAGLALGVVVLVMTTWLVEGMSAAMNETYAGRIPHVIVRGPVGSETGLADLQGFEGTIGEAVPGLEALTATLDLSVVLQEADSSASNPAESTAAKPHTADSHMTVRGLELARAGALYPLGGAMVGGRTFVSGREIVLGSVLAARHSIEVGDSVVLDDERGRKATFAVVGIFDLKLEEENATLGFVDLAALQAAFGMEGMVRQIELQLEDAFEAEAVSVALASALGQPSLYIKSWETTHRQLFEAASLQGQAILLLKIAVTMIILIGAVLILSLSVHQRSSQLAAFKSLGLRDDQGVLVFALYALYLSLFGIVIGILAGSGLIRLYKQQTILGFSAYQQTPNPDLGSLALTLAVMPLASALAAWGVAKWVLGKDPAEVICRG